MKRMRLAMCVAVFALVGGFALAEDLDVRALQAKLAEQEARLNDLQAKMGNGSASAYGMGADVGNVAPEMPEAILSRKKNGVVRIGGTINTRYFYRNYTVDGYDRSSLNYKYDTACADTSGFTFAQDGKVTGLSQNTASALANAYASNSVYFGDSVKIGDNTYSLSDLNKWAAKANGVAASDFEWMLGQRGIDLDNQIGSLNNGYGVASHTVGATPTYANAGRLANYRSGDLKVSDAKVNFKIDVNDFFDAYIELNLLDGADSERANVAQRAWVRWKNVCNSGFGVLVGRGDVPFGTNGTSYGAGAVITNWTGGGTGDHGDGTTTLASRMVPRLGWDYSRTTQINPYWESKDGKYRFDFSLFEAIDMKNPIGFWDYYESGTTKEYRTINYGLGSFAARLRASPIEGLNLYASFMNAYNQWADDADGHAWKSPAGTDYGKWGGILNQGFEKYNKNNMALDLAFDYTPAAFNRLKIYGQWLHNWNGGWIDDFDSDTFNAGIKFKVNEQLAFFAEGDYIKASVSGSNYNTNRGPLAYTKSQKGWASYIGVQYSLPYGVMGELGWRHEDLKNKDINGVENFRLKGDVIYGHLGFSF